jgi:hypothetical protein
MNDMNAKQLFERNSLTELEGSNDPLQGTPSPERPQRLGRRPGFGDFMRAGGPGSTPDDVERVMGREGGAPRGQFSPKEVSQLKDVLILILANISHSDLDRDIGQALMTGQELQPGQLQHILDEARNVQLPETHGALLQKVFQQLGQR